jgi:LPS export ABC transporter protein LptC
MRMRSPLSVILLLAAACSAETAPTGTDYQALPAEMVTVGMRYYSTEGNRSTAELRADTAFEFQDSSGYRLRGVDLVIFDENTGEQTATLTSERGTFDRNTEAMVARGNVVLITSEGRRIETPELHYEPVTGMMWSDSTSVLIHDGERTLAQRGFEAKGVADGRLGTITIRGPQGRFSGSVIF